MFSFLHSISSQHEPRVFGSDFFNHSFCTNFCRSSILMWEGVRKITLTFFLFTLHEEKKRKNPENYSCVHCWYIHLIQSATNDNKTDLLQNMGFHLLWLLGACDPNTLTNVGCVRSLSN